MARQGMAGHGTRDEELGDAAQLGAQGQQLREGLDLAPHKHEEQNTHAPDVTDTRARCVCARVCLCACV